MDELVQSVAGRWPVTSRIYARAALRRIFESQVARLRLGDAPLATVSAVLQEEQLLVALLDDFESIVRAARGDDEP